MGTVGALGSRCYPGRSTYGGDTRSNTVREFGSGDGPGQWTHGGDVTFRTIRAFGSECSPGRSTYGGDPRYGTARAFGSSDDLGRWTFGWDVGLGTVEHSVLDMALDNGLAQGSGEPMFGSDCGLTFTEIPDAMKNVDLGLGAAVPFPVDDVGRVALPPAEARRNDSDICIADIHTEGFQCWNMDRDILDQYETFNGLPVYYGGDMYDSEDSEWDDLYALASAAYVEDYNFDVLAGMDLMVHRRSRIRDGSEAQQDDHTDIVGLGTVEHSVLDLASDSLDIEICCDSDVGSVADLEWNTWDDACALAFQVVGGAFPPEAAVIRPAVVIRNRFRVMDDMDVLPLEREPLFGGGGLAGIDLSRARCYSTCGPWNGCER